MSRPIEAILKSFVHHVIDLQNEEDPAGSGYNREFRILREKQVEDKNNNRFPMEEGRKEENIKKNRYKDILPRDDRRVKLKEIPGEAGSDYINASFIEDVDGHRGYIAAQGPMPHTVNDFWRMLWQYNTEIVFMACRLKEDGKAKCEKYWPEQGESIMFGNIKVHTESEEEVQDHFIKRRLHVEKKGFVHRLLQFQYVGWPDHNVPSSPDALRRMIEEVRNHRKLMNIPMVVHCSAGCGRTGTICAIDFAWTLLDKGMVTEGFSMFEVIKCLREQRISMVQTPDQYEYTHMVMKSLCNEWLVSFSKHDYENVALRNANPQLEEPEESYYNVDFQSSQSHAKDPSSSSRPTSKDSSAAPQTPRPHINKRPEIKTQKPDITRPKPEIAAQKPDILKPKPQDWSKTKGATTATYTNAAPISEEYAGGLRIGKGTTGRSAIRQKSHSRPTVGSAGQQGHAEQEDGAEAAGMVYEVVHKNRPSRKSTAPLYENQSGLLYENHHMSPGNNRLVPDGDYANEMIRGPSSEEAAPPALPSRHYKPEEISKVAGDRSNPSGPHHRHGYNNIPSASTPQPAAPNLSRGNVHRTHQPIPVNPPPSSSAPISAPQPTRGGPALSPRMARRQGQAVADSSSPGMGNPAPGAAASQPRSGWMESSPSHGNVKRDFPGIFSGGAHVPAESPRSHSANLGVIQQGLGLFQKVLTLTRSPNKEGQKHVVAAPGPGQTIQVRGGKSFYVLERVPRVRGPRPPPAGWSSYNKNQNQRGHYL